MTWADELELTDEQRSRCVRFRMAVHQARYATPLRPDATSEEFFGWVIGFLTQPTFAPAPRYGVAPAARELPPSLNGMLHFYENKRPER